MHFFKFHILILFFFEGNIVAKTNAAKELEESDTPRLDHSGSRICFGESLGDETTSTSETIDVRTEDKPKPAGIEYTGEAYGEGAFGKVRKCMWKGKPWAVKTIQFDPSNPDVMSFVNSELQVLIRLKGVPFMNHLEDWWVSESVLYLIMEPIDGADLADIIAEVAESSSYNITRYRRFFDASVTKHIIAQAIAAVEQMHNVNIIHRDLKPHNIMIERETGKLKIIDFGMAKHGEPDSHFCGSPLYAGPPDLWFKKGGKMSEASDRYALAVTILWLLGSVSKPERHSWPKFHETTLPTYKKSICEAAKQQKVPDPDSSMIQICEILDYLFDPSKDLSYVKAHPWFRDIDWDTLEIDIKPLPKLDSVISEIQKKKAKPSDSRSAAA